MPDSFNDCAYALNTALTSSTSRHSWWITTARGTGTGLVLSPMVLELKMAVP